MPRIIMNHPFIARCTSTPHSIELLSASASSHHSLSSAAFIINIAESDFRHAQPGLAIGLGGVGVTLNDLVALYAGLARLGTTLPLTERTASGEEAPMPRRL